MSYIIKIYDNFHYMMEDEAYNHGKYETLESALQEAKKIIHEFFADDQYKENTFDEIKGAWWLYGDEPVIFPINDSPDSNFSAYDYVRDLTSADLKK